MVLCALLLLLAVQGALGVQDEDIRVRKDSAQCEDFKDLDFNCVPYWQCNANRTIITDGSNLISVRTVENLKSSEDVQLLESAYASNCSKIVEVCCRLLRKPNDQSTETGGETGGEKRPRKDASVRPRCGRRGDPDAAAQKSTDKAPLEIPETFFGEWPHVCMILKEEAIQIGEVVPLYRSGASLLAPEVILTGVNRINTDLEDLSKLVVRCGEWDVISIAEEKPFQERRVVRAEKHPDYNPDNSFYNFLILYLDRPFDLDTHINPVCLPSPRLSLPAGTLCIANGWGKDRFGNDGKYHTRMKEVSLGLVDSQKCQDMLRQTRLGKFFELHSSFICAGGSRGVDTCKGDGGSPLTCQTDTGVWTQVGLVAWGVSCGEEDTPGVYSYVPHVSCWIDAVVSRYFAKTNDFQGSYFGFTNADCPERIA